MGCEIKKIYLWLISGVLGVGLLQPAAAAGKHYTLVSGERNFYYGYISYIPEEPGARVPEVIRVGLTGPEPVRLNFPLGPGDVIVTYDKPCEIQFDSGTIVRLGTDTRLKIETIMAQSLSSDDQLSNLVLEKGQIYLMYTAYNSWEVFQLLTVNAALKMKNKTVLIVRVTDDGETRLMVKKGKANLLYGPSARELKTLTARKGNSFLVDAGHRVESKENFPEFSPFEAWNAELNKHFLELHKGLTPMPKPLQKLPPAVFYFAQQYGNKYGEWIWDDFLGYVWRPFYNDNYPWGNWSPYYYGNWTYLHGQLFWVPAEPWGWVPYHLGIWHWDKKKGWVWIPGSAFAPAWAVWDFYFGYYAWRPWLLYDWLGFYGYTYNYGYVGWDGGYAEGGQQRSVISRISKDQLKKGQTQTTPIPDGYKKMVASLARAIDRGDRNVLEKISVNIPEPRLIKAADLGAQDRAVSMVKFSEVVDRVNQARPETNKSGTERGVVPPWNLAVNSFLKNRNQEAAGSLTVSESKQTRTIPAEKPTLKQPGQLAETPAGLAPKTGNRTYQRVPDSSGLASRFRDWNPDLKTARQLGISIVYDSSRNSIVFPELKFSSVEARSSGLRIAPHGFVVASPSAGSPGGSVYSGSSGDSSSGSSSSNVASRSDSGSRSSGGERSSGGKASSSGNEKH